MHFPWIIKLLSLKAMFVNLIEVDLSKQYQMGKELPLCTTSHLLVAGL